MPTPTRQKNKKQKQKDVNDATILPLIINKIIESQIHFNYLLYSIKLFTKVTMIRFQNITSIYILYVNKQ